MNNGVVLVVIDALGYDVATRRAGYLEGLCEDKRAAKYRVDGELPAISRPMYETIMTGLPVWRHGVTSNACVCRSACENLFSLTRSQGRTNAVAGYRWMLELYGTGRPFEPLSDCYWLDGVGDIDHGIFYAQDEYPDAQVYADGEYLRKTYRPDFLLIHPMGVDLAGHLKGAGSPEYELAAAVSLDWIAQLAPGWRAEGYDVVVTADHGMDRMGLHEGNDLIQRTVPLYILSDRVEGGDFSQDLLTTRAVAPLVCALLGITRGEGMQKSVVRGLAP